MRSETIPQSMQRPSHSGRRVALRLMILVALCIGTVGTAFAWVTPAPKMPAGQKDVLFPDVSVDQSGNVHAVWMHSDNQDFNQDLVYYMHGKMNSAGDSVAWDSPQLLSGVKAKYPRPPRVVADNSEVVHVTYGGADGRVYYLRNSNHGAAGSWSTETVASVSGEFFQPVIAVDSAGTPYIAWTEGLGNGQSHAVMTYRLGSNSWKGRITISPSVYLSRYSDIAVTGAGDSATVHVVFEYKEKQTDSTYRAGYTRGLRTGGFISANFSQSFGYSSASNPSIGVDRASGRLFAAFVTGSISNDFVLKLTTSTSNGSSWAGPATLQVGPRIWPETSSIDVAKDVAHIVADEKYWSGSSITQVLAYYQSFDATNSSYSDPVRISNVEISRAPRISVNGPGKVAIWTTNNTEAIRYNVDPGGGGGVGIQADPQLEGGKAVTNKSQLALTFTNLVGSPDKVRYRWDAPPTGNETLVSINPAPILVNAPINVSTATCNTHTLYTLAHNSETGQDAAAAKAATITFDGQTQAAVQISNPNLVSVPTAWATSERYDPTNPGLYGARDGDPRYTRDEQFFLGIYDLNDCTGLTRFSVPGSAVAMPISNGRFEGKVHLDATTISNPGTKTRVDVQVDDGVTPVPNVLFKSQDMIYDPADTNPDPAVTNTLGLPVYKAGAVTVDNSNTKSIFRDLTFSGVNVDDTTYGSFESLSAGKQFWGVWIASSRNVDVGPDNPNLQWFPVHVPTPQAGFTVKKWNILTGLDVDPSRQGGTYYIYVRFLDGAGNATRVGIKATNAATLGAGYDLPTRYISPITR